MPFDGERSAAHFDRTQCKHHGRLGLVWREFLQLNSGNPSRSGLAGHLTINWGNGSAAGTGGTSKTLEAFNDFKLLPMETWMGAWATHLNHFSSMVRTLDSSLVFRMKLSVQPKAFDAERRLKQSRVTQVGPCREAGLELHSGCQVEAIHIPGRLMTGQGSDDLSWGAWIDPKRLLRSSLDESMLTLEAVPFSMTFVHWLLPQVGCAHWTLHHHHTGISN